MIDQEWEKEKWEESWETGLGVEVDEETLKTSGMTKSKQEGEGSRQKRARGDGAGSSWGEVATEDDHNRADFLQGSNAQQAGSKQSRVKVFTGLEWMMREILKGLAHTAVELSTLTKGADQWEQWDMNIKTQSKPTEDPHQHPKRSKKEERQLNWISSSIKMNRRHKQRS